MNSSLRRRIIAFDRRYLASQQQAGILRATADEEYHQQHAHQAQCALGTLEAHDEESDLPFKVVRWSSHGGEHPGTELEKSGDAHWETAPMHVHNEYLVLEVNGGTPATVTGLRLTLPGRDAGPRHVKVQYSKQSPNGPWSEGWRFAVRSKQSKLQRSRHCYVDLSDEFKTQLASLCGGSVEGAWREYLDVNGDGRLSHYEFMNACARLKEVLPSSKKSSWTENTKLLFEQLDTDHTGEVTLDDLQRTARVAPEAPWWRLLLVSNWGSTSNVVLCAPLNLVTVVTNRYGGITNMRARFKSSKLKFSAPMDEQRPGLAQATQLPLCFVEDVHELFDKLAAAPDALDVKGFNALVPMLVGADAADVPKARLRYFWIQAARSRNSVTFSEFLFWFNAAFPRGKAAEEGAAASPVAAPAARQTLRRGMLKVSVVTALKSEPPPAKALPKAEVVMTRRRTPRRASARKAGKAKRRAVFPDTEDWMGGLIKSDCETFCRTPRDELCFGLGETGEPVLPDGDSLVLP